jgi:hypothetical protein
LEVAGKPEAYRKGSGKAAKHQAQSTKYKAPSTKHKAQSTKHKTQYFFCKSHPFDHLIPPERFFWRELAPKAARDLATEIMGYSK